MSVPVIAVDGPSASGKGTVAARVAARLGFHLLDSGALYRVVALAGLRGGVPLDDAQAMARIAVSLPLTFEADRVLLGSEDVTLAIRSEEISAGASRVAALPAVRAALLERQRAFRQLPGLVADGRDMATVVFPDAPVKVFLTASAEARAERRHKQLIEKGLPATLTSLLQDLHERDARDAKRSVAPLARSADAALVDTTEMTIEQAVEAVLGLARKGLAGRSGNSGVAPPTD